MTTPQTTLKIPVFTPDSTTGQETVFRAADDYSISDQRPCLLLRSGDVAEWQISLPATVADQAGGAALVIDACLGIHADHAYADRHINSMLRITINDTLIFDGVHHWRSHPETVAFWNPFDFPFGPHVLRPGKNRIRLENTTSRAGLGEFFDPDLGATLGLAEVEQRLGALYLADLQLRQLPAVAAELALGGVPRSAIAGKSVIVEVCHPRAEETIRPVNLQNTRVSFLGDAFEFGMQRALFRLVPLLPGRECRLDFLVSNQLLTCSIPVIYPDTQAAALSTGPGAESTYWHHLLTAAQGFFTENQGTCLRICIDDFLANLHFIPPADWYPLITYLIRREREICLLRHRTPPYSRILPEHLAELAELAGDRFIGTTLPEFSNFLATDSTSAANLQRRLQQFLAAFKKRLKETRLPGQAVVTFDSAGALAGHYYRCGLDMHVTELGPRCNCFEESCCRGAAGVHGKPWGIAAAMQWYYGQGAAYPFDQARVRLARLTMLHSYFAGARHIVWEGGCFNSLPVYNYILTPETWRDQYREYDDAEPQAIRRNFSQLLEIHQALQLPAPRVRFAVLQGHHATIVGRFTTEQSTFGDLSIARSDALISVFLPHFSHGRGPTDDERPQRRWYSFTPFGQVDVIPDYTSVQHLRRYPLLAILGWNTMTEKLHRNLLAYVRHGGTLFLSLPHCVTDRGQTLRWSFFRQGDLHELAGVQVHGAGHRVDEVTFDTAEFQEDLPRKLALSSPNPLFPEDFGEDYPVFGTDVSYVAGDITITDDTEVLARGQAGNPVILSRRLGRGRVVFLNCWHHPGRGRFRQLAQGVLRSLARAVPTPLRVEDPARVISWFEYEHDAFRRFLFVNTDWTGRTPAAPVTVHTPQGSIDFTVPPDEPMQLFTDEQDFFLVPDLRQHLQSWPPPKKNPAAAFIGPVPRTVQKVAPKK